MRSLPPRVLLLVALAFSTGAVACATSITPGSGGAGGAGGAGSGGEPSASSGSGMAVDAGHDATGPCTSAADCASAGDACNTGACINGVCGKLPANELGACDDGINCTENDTCQEGVCTGGTTKFCPATDTCSIGSCDIMLDMCVQVPGNDGAPCNDNDACTLPGSCLAGVCNPGGMVDCSFLDGTCSVGYCDSLIGCKVMPQADGAPCDDNLYCTINDACNAGQCAGVPNTCAAPGDVCMIGSCDEANDKCTAVPGNNGGACNDNNLCTTGETCSNGVCQGGVPANNGAMCDDGNGCTMGTTCSNGICGNPQSSISQCINDDNCCPANCMGGGIDNDCEICHPIVAPPGNGWACPSGKTEWCTSDPFIDPTSPSQAQKACETCYGTPCFLENADCAGPGFGPSPPGQYIGGNAYFGYTSGCSGDDGRVWAISSSFTTYGYWGKN